jgi:hypothetical protein
LRTKVMVLKSAGSLSEEKAVLSEWVKVLEAELEALDLKSSLAVINHLRHARKALSIASSDVGSAFRCQISRAERARLRKRNRPPVLGIPDRAQLPEGYGVGPVGEYLQPHVLGNGSK